MLLFGEQVGRVKSEGLEVVLSNIEDRFGKKNLVNDIPRRRADFVGHLPSVLFTPVDLELITDGPGVRRRYLDFVLEQVDRDYSHALAQYERALRSRNRLLELAKKTRRRIQEHFDYWDGLLIANGEIITRKREEYLAFINDFKKDIFKLSVVYDKSIISLERLSQYQDREIEACATLVGPHRDDFKVFMEKDREIKVFGSRSQQRLAVLQLKIIELAFMKSIKDGQKPLLLLDDIFSELDQGHIDLVLDMAIHQQTVITTTHREFVDKKLHKTMSMIELGKG